jgi:hypothetical protein
METNFSTKTPVPNVLEIEGSIASHPILDLLRADSRLSSLPSGKKLLVADAETYFGKSESTRTNQLLLEGTSVLLLNASEKVKQGMVAHIGLGSPGNSTAFMISARPAANDRLTYVLHDLLSESMAAVKETAPDSFEGKFPEGAPDPGADPAPELKEVQAESADHAFINEMFTTLLAPSVKEVADANQPPQQQWIFNKTLPWACPQRSKSHGHTPQAQNTYITVTYTFIVYLDSQASGNFQWLYLQCLGYQSVGANGMNEDYHNQRGWANGFLGVKIPTPKDFFINQNSPTNVNNATTYTSSVSFNVGVDSDGPSGGVAVSHEKSETITDWGVKLNDLNNWTFYQQNPWDARKMKADGGKMVSYNAGQARYEIKPLPNLSTGVMNFSTMSVWNNQKVSQETIPVTINLNAEWNYLGLKNSWPSYTVTLWPQTFGPLGMTYHIDLSLVS